MAKKKNFGITRELLEHDLCKLGMSRYQVAKKYRCGWGTVDRYIRKHDIQLPIKKIDSTTKEQLETDFFELGLSAVQVARKYSCGVGTVSRRIQKHGIQLDPVAKHIPSRYARLLYLHKVKLTGRQASIVVGSTLGDGYIAKVRGNAWLTCTQCNERRDYLEWLRAELQPFAPRQVNVAHSPNGGSWSHFGTVHSSEFTRFHNVFYPNGRKIIPRNMGDYLDELALAVWFMDDGHTKKYYSVMCTHCFTVSECELLLMTLYKQFSLECRVKVVKGNGRSYPMLRFDGENHYRLHGVVDPLLHPVFEYKKLPQGAVYQGRPRGERHYNAKLSASQVREVRRLVASGTSRREVETRFGMSTGAIDSIISGKTWRHLLV